MRDPNRIPKIIKRLEKLWKKHPDLRLGHPILNMRQPIDVESIYFLEDEELMNELEKLYERK